MAKIIFIESQKWTHPQPNSHFCFVTFCQTLKLEDAPWISFLICRKAWQPSCLWNAAPSHTMKDKLTDSFFDEGLVWVTEVFRLKLDRMSQPSLGMSVLIRLTESAALLPLPNTASSYSIHISHALSPRDSAAEVNSIASDVHCSGPAPIRPFN